MFTSRSGGSPISRLDGFDGPGSGHSTSAVDPYETVATGRPGQRALSERRVVRVSSPSGHANAIATVKLGGHALREVYFARSTQSFAARGSRVFSRSTSALNRGVQRTGSSAGSIIGHSRRLVVLSGSSALRSR